MHFNGELLNEVLIIKPSNESLCIWYIESKVMFRYIKYMLWLVGLREGGNKLLMAVRFVRIIFSLNSLDLQYIDIFVTSAKSWHPYTVHSNVDI